MAITVGTAATNMTTTGLTNTVSITCPATAKYLVGFLIVRTSTVPTATYNGVSMTKLASSRVGTSSDYFYCFLLANPSTGAAYNAVATHAATANNMWAAFYVAADGSITVENSSTVASSGTSNTVTVASSTDSIVIAGSCQADMPGTDKASQTSLVNSLTQAAVMEVSYKAGASSVSMGWTFSADDYVIIGFNVRESIMSSKFFLLF